MHVDLAGMDTSVNFAVLRNNFVESNDQISLNAMSVKINVLCNVILNFPDNGNNF